MLYEVITDLADRTSRFANAIASLGVERGDRIVITSYSIHYTKLYEGFHAVEFSASYDLLRDRGPLEKLQIYTRVQNVFDTTYEEVKGFPASGTTAFGGVRLFMF